MFRGIRVSYFNACPPYPLHFSEPFLYFLRPLSHFKLLYALYTQVFFFFLPRRLFSTLNGPSAVPTFLHRIRLQFAPSLSLCLCTFTEYSSFFFILFQMKGRNRNTKIKSFKIASRDKVLQNYFTTLKNCFKIFTLVAFRLKVYYVFLLPEEKSGYPHVARMFIVY